MGTMKNARKTKPMYVVGISFDEGGRTTRDVWTVHEDLENARLAYSASMAHDTLHCACICKMIEGTDWPADEEELKRDKNTMSNTPVVDEEIRTSGGISPLTAKELELKLRMSNDYLSHLHFLFCVAENLSPEQWASVRNKLKGWVEETKP